MSRPSYLTISQTVGNTPLVRLQRIPGAENDIRNNVILGKLEGNNPAGSVKDRPALSMILRAQERGEIKPFKSCERCHKSQVRRDGGRAIQAHHYLGYENPLAVEWLCPKCHQKADAARADAARKEPPAKAHGCEVGE